MQKASERHFRSIIEKNADGIIIVDKKGIVRFANPAAEFLFERTSEEFIGKPFGFPVLSGEKTEINIVRNNGEILIAEMHVIQTTWEGESVYQASLRDVTELKKLAKIKDEFISIVSHELRTPLSIIKEAISLILDKVPGEINEQQNKILVISKNNIDRLSRLINDLLDMSKIEAGKVELRKTKVDVTSAIKVVASTFEAKAEEKGLELKMRCPEKGVDIFVDEDKMIQLLTILFDNAVKFTSQGFIEVSLQEKENTVECAFVDTGIGIPMEDLPKMFDKFTQFGRNNGPGEKGTGLGLSIAKGIVEVHKGKIWVESKVGKGTKFAFSLPKLSSEEVFKEYLSDAIRDAKEKWSYFSVIMISIQNFKELIQKSLENAKITINKIEEIMKESLRSTDIIVSDTGEILLILPEVKRESAIGVVRRIKEKLKRYLSARKDLKGRINLATKIISYPEQVREEGDILSNMKELADG